MVTTSAVLPSLSDVCRRLSCDDCDLPHLDLTGLNIGNGGAAAVGSSLVTNTHLRSLTLSYNLISPIGAIGLTQHGFKGIERFDLRHNSIGNDGAAALASAVPFSKLKVLSVRNNYIGPSGGVELIESLEYNFCLEQLDLGTNLIGNEGAVAIRRLLETNTHLKVLSLWSNDIDSEGIRQIALGLRVNTTLQLLYLGGNIIGDDGANELADMLGYNHTLKSLHIANGHISTNGAVALANAMIDNRSLQVIDLLHNRIGFMGANAFCLVLKADNRTMLELRIDFQTDMPYYYDGDKAVNAEIAVYVKMNQMGRGEMTRLDMPWSTWPHILKKMSVEPDLLYLSILDKPELMKVD